MPLYTEVWIFSGIIELDRGHFDQADAFLEQANRIKPTMKATGWQERVGSARAAAAATTRSATTRSVQ